jgi:PAS domain S-box-containing protein
VCDPVVQVGPAPLAEDATQELHSALSTYHEALLIQNEQLQAAHVELEKSHDRYARLYDEAPVGYVTLDRNGVVESANLTAVALLGASRAIVIGRPMLVFVHKNDRSTFLNFMLVCRNSKGAERQWVDLRLRGHSREYRYVQLSSVAVARDSGKGMVYLTTLTDISGRIRHEQERRIAEEQIAQAQRERATAEAANEAKDRFLATLSHELRTPISAILLWAKLLQESPVSNLEQLREGLHAIATSAEVQKELIEDLLDMSRIAAGKMRLLRREIELVPVVRDAFNAIQPSAIAKKVSVSADFDPAVGTVRVDPDRVRQIVWNLLTNAVKFTPAGGKARLQIMRRGSEVDIEVTDSGSGIPPEFLPHVFESFQQADSSNTRSHSGIGLGLTIVKQLVELHGGTIIAYSEGIDRGSKLAVRLPLPELSQRQIAPVSEMESHVDPIEDDWAGGSVLVVEGDPETRSALTTLLRQTGLQVTEADSAASAIESFSRSQPDLLISDIGLPGMDGYALINRIRKDEAVSHHASVPAIALTAFAREADRRMAIEAGYQEHVGKPVEPTQLLTAIKCVMHSRQAALH